MNYENYQKEFVFKAQQIGYSAENIERCLLYAKQLINKNLPVIYNASHLSGLVGYKTSYLNRAIVFTNFFYRVFKIKKSTTGFRSISEPLPSLKEIQSWILENILYQIPSSKFAKAYIPGVSLKQNLVFHRNQAQVLKLDIKDFFGNIRRPRIEAIFRHEGYSYNVSNMLSKLCTLHECLPQGAPTSAYLSNLVMRKFDESVSEICLNNEIRYSRYADDLTFSGEFNSDFIIDLVKQELKELSLELNVAKTRLMKQGQKQTVTGVVVNSKLQVDRVKRKNIRQEIYYIKKSGLNDHLKRRKITKANYISHLLGKILFVLFINPSDEEFISYKAYLNSL